MKLFHLPEDQAGQFGQRLGYLGGELHAPDNLPGLYTDYAHGARPLTHLSAAMSSASSRPADAGEEERVFLFDNRFLS